MISPYFDDGTVALYHGRVEDVLPQLDIRPALVLADPPYSETALEWDQWPDGWPALLAGVASSMWCFGSMRMFLDRRDEFADWRLSQDIIWEKHNGTGFTTDRFRRVHENATHWYRGPWSDIHHEVPRVPRTHSLDKSVTRRAKPTHTGAIGNAAYADDGLRLMPSVLREPSVRGGLSATQKPPGIVGSMIRYGCPPGGLILVPFAGSGAELVVARDLGMRAVGIEMREEQCESAALWLSATPLFVDEVAL